MPDPVAIRALVVAAGRAPDRTALDASWPGWSDGVGLVIAADGGAAAARDLGFRPDLVVGDLDSIDRASLEMLRADGIPIEVAPVAKDESDTELAVQAAVSRGATELVLVGALGGRIDHLVANLGLLAHPGLAGRSVTILDERTRIVLVRGPSSRSLVGRPGDVLSLLPFGAGVTGVRTRGLAWTLDDEPLPPGPARGLSNVRIGRVVEIAVRTGDLLVIEVVGPV